MTEENTKSLCEILGDYIEDEAKAKQEYSNLKENIREASRQQGLSPLQTHVLVTVVDKVSADEQGHGEIYRSIGNLFKCKIPQV